MKRFRLILVWPLSGPVHFINVGHMTRYVERQTCRDIEALIPGALTSVHLTAGPVAPTPALNVSSNWPHDKRLAAILEALRASGFKEELWVSSNS